MVLSFNILIPRAVCPLLSRIFGFAPIESKKAEEITQLYPQAYLYPVSHDYWKISAAWLIRQNDWVGKRYGAVGVHSRQPLVLVNYGGATGKEILDLAHKISDSVYKKFNIKLEPEVNIV